MSPINFRKLAVSLAMFAVVALGSTAVAKADPITFTLGLPNSGIAAFPGPYATVTVDATTTKTATITVTALTQGAYTYLIGNGGSIGLNLNAPAGSVVTNTTPGGIVQPQPTALAPIYSRDDNSNVDGWGSFNFVLDNFDGYQHSVQTMTFTITCDLCNWATSADVLTPNNLGNVIASHIFVTTNGGATNTGETGYATVGSLPEPTSMLLLGTGLIGIAAGFRKRFRK